MGKRKRKEKESDVSKRLKRIERYLCPSSSPDSNEHGYRSRSRSRSHSHHHRYGDLRSSSPERDRSRSPSRTSSLSDSELQAKKSLSSVVAEPGPSTNNRNDNTKQGTSLPEDILEALGDPKSKDEVFGPDIPDEISKRWGRVLIDGLTREQKQENMERTLVPENFKLVKAPLLNPEIAAVLSESVRNRDKILEKSQNHLGLGIAGLSNFTASLIESDMSKIDIIKRLSEITQIFLDLHSENTKNRRKLVISSLDKKFVNMIGNVKRDTYLFGADLGDKIKASKTAERSGLQIKRSDGATASSSRKYNQQGNWRGPPRSYNQYSRQQNRQGGQRNRYSNASNRRPPQAADSQSAATTAKGSYNKQRKS